MIVFIGGLLPDVVQILHHRGRIFVDAQVVIQVGKGSDVQHVEHQHGVIGGQRPSRFGNDVGMRQVFLFADFIQMVDHVIGVFLHRIVGAGSERGAGAVVIHPQPAADVDVFDIASLLHQFGVVAADFLEAGFDPADVGDLASQMKMDQADAILDVLLLGNFQSFHQFDRAQAEFGVFAAGGSPAARSGADQLDAQADVRPDVEFLGDADDGFQFRQPFDHDEYFFAQLLTHQRQPDERFVLVAVADQQGFRIVHDGEDGMQFRFGTGFQSDVVGAAEFYDFFDDLPLLVDLDRVHAMIGSVVVVFPGGLLEGLGQSGDAGFEDVRKADQDRQRITLRLDIIHQTFQVDGMPAGFVGADDHMAFRVDAEISRSPALDVVQFQGFFDGPFLHQIFRVMKVAEATLGKDIGVCFI